MYQNPKQLHTEKPSVATLAVLTAVFGFGCLMLGYLLLPFAAAFYATLLMYENRNGKLLSYVIPVVLFILNIFLNGFFSLEAIGYVVVGLIIYLSYTKNRTKAEAAFLATFAVAVLIIISLVLIAFDEIGAVRLSAVSEFYSSLYYKLKELFINTLVTLKTVDADGITQYRFNSSEAEEIFISVIPMLLPLLVISSFLISGIAFKLFSGSVLKYSETKEKILAWNFGASSIVAYFYLIVSLLSLFKLSGSFELIILPLNVIFMTVFAYIGLKVLYAILSVKKSTLFAIVVLAAAFILLSTAALQFASYFGVYFTIICNSDSASKRRV